MGDGHHGELVHGAHVGVHHAVVLLHARALDAAHLQHPRVVDQHVQLPEPGHGLRDDPGAVLLQAEVRADDEGLAAALPRRGRQVVRVPPRDGHRGALPREVDCRGGADARAGAGDDGDLARQGTHHTSRSVTLGGGGVSSKQFSHSPLCSVQ